MITRDQASLLSKQFKINETVIVREYLQLLFLKELYSEKFSQKIYFKGGTAVRLVYGGTRFSEDLDFTVSQGKRQFEKSAKTLFSRLTNTYPISFKERNTIAGKTFLITGEVPGFSQEIFIRLDFSFRNDVIAPVSAIIENRGYPIIFTNFIWTLSKDEVLAEKIRALMKRDKFRDLYDIWMLMELGAKVDTNLVNRKLAYYDEVFEQKRFLKRLDSINREKFAQDLRPFIPINEREQLGKLFSYIVQYLKDKLGNV